jgi:Mor family transcriptional regulator
MMSIHDVREPRQQLGRLQREVQCLYEGGGNADDNIAMELLALLGREKFRALQERFGGRRIWIPKSGGALLCRFCPTRDEHIRQLRHEGRSVAWIAQQFGLSEKRVYGILEEG